MEAEKTLPGLSFSLLGDAQQAGGLCVSLLKVPAFERVELSELV